MTINHQNLSAFLSAALKSPSLRQKITAAIEADETLEGAYELFDATHKPNADELDERVMAVVREIESDDVERQVEAIKTLEADVFKEMNARGFTEQWVASRMFDGD